MAPVAAPPCRSTVASGGVKVPSVDELRGGREESHGTAQRMTRRQVGVESRERAEAPGFLQLERAGWDVVGSIADTARTAERNNLSLISGPPISKRGENAEIPVMWNAEPRFVRNDGSRLLTRSRHLILGTARLNQHEPRRKASELDGVRVRQHRDRVDRVIGQRHRRQAGRWIDEDAWAELHARLARSSALDGDAARNLNHADDQPQRRLQSTAARVDLFQFAAAEDIARGEGAGVWNDGLWRHDLDLLPDHRQAQVEVDLGGLSGGDNGRRARRFEAFQRRCNFVVPRLQIVEPEGAVTFGNRQRRRPRALREFHRDAAKRNRCALGRDDAFDAPAAASGRRRSDLSVQSRNPRREEPKEEDQDTQKLASGRYN